MKSETANTRKRRPQRGRFAPILVPIKDGFEMIGVGPTKGYELVADGTIETVKVGRQRLAVVESLKKLAQPSAA